MLDDLSITTGAIAFFALMAAGFMRGFIGFGSNMIIMPVLSLTVGPLGAIAIGTLIGIPATLQLLPTAIRESEHKVVIPMSIAILLACPFGVLFLVTVDPGLMKILISATVIVLVAMLAKGWKLKGDVSRCILIGAGTVGGLVQGASALGGPPVVAVALSRPGTTAQQRANVLAVMTTVSLSAILPMLYFGLLTTEALLISAASFPFYSIATWLGMRYFSTEGEKHYRKAALMTLAAVGFITLSIAGHDYLLSPSAPVT